ncbi:eukaryotic translation initiation factor 4E family member 2 related sequence 1 isoform X3 [Antennarius striatus]|uniref:eukaryotic translation initiation factor 4E family member 2 related sequence 1 isoform X3 n=1 Tax=Antennarius striatus TaxID=241820 RepID=UPI0035AFB6CB
MHCQKAEAACGEAYEVSELHEIASAEERQKRRREITEDDEPARADDDQVESGSHHDNSDGINNNKNRRKVEQFWRFYSHLVRPGDLSGHSDFHLFKEGIKPMWEDESNRSGGKWIIRLRKGLASRFWENIILAMLGEQFMVGEEICGAVVSIRFQEDILSIWNRTSNDQTTTSRIRDTLRRVLNLPNNTIMEYKTHNDSLRDNSSYRNTKISL